MRISFYFHILVAACCIACGALDATGRPMGWLIPNVAAFYTLLSSAMVFPILAAISFVRTHHKHAALVIVAHVALSLGQLILGLLPLIS